jgi:hypothetical protein
MKLNGRKINNEPYDLDSRKVLVQVTFTVTCQWQPPSDQSMTAYPEKTKDDRRAEMWIEYDPPIRWEKAHPIWPNRYTLQMSILGIKERHGQ